MKAQERIAFITKIAAKDEGIGKTAMMKFLYLLQTLYDVPLGYDFEIYTYGPYCQSVMSDLEFAEFGENIQIASITYPNGMNGYNIEATPKGKDGLTHQEDLLNQYSDAVDAVISFFKDKSAKELELYSTTVFVFSSFKDNSWKLSKEEICKTVKKIKPHFSMETISTAYDDLSENHFLK